MSVTSFLFLYINIDGMDVFIGPATSDGSIDSGRTAAWPLMAEVRHIVKKNFELKLDAEKKSSLCSYRDDDRGVRPAGVPQ